MENTYNNLLIELNDILKAQSIINGHVHWTPLVSSATLGQQIGANLHFKAEVFQKTGSFKPRGALNKLHSLTLEEKKQGVITISAGNHAQGLAYASSLLGIKATVIMPQNAVKSKVEATKDYGAEVILHGTHKDLMPKCREVQRERDLILIHPFDDPFVIAGQGTIGLEILEDLPTVEMVVVPIGGGALVSGIATAIKSKKPDTKIIGVEPTGAAVMTKSIQQNKVVHLDEINTVADGLAAPFAGRYTIAHVKEYVDKVVLVSDEEIIAALRLILERCKILTEPSGAASFAALLFDKIAIPKNSHVVCVLSGGNVDISMLKKIL
ncbi:threonine/serine dehydratase [Candidatus Borrarchaeum sp.]|uniref:threonine ammonia-lyase n=1 Tax=Candidatus Borrarchaeum sp. TaxID=2846742 RepID=UPI00257A8C0B|nr:threonine/serine dehydratase [Candidatus Borrarchaeum sp.]